MFFSSFLVEIIKNLTLKLMNEDRLLYRSCNVIYVICCGFYLFLLFLSAFPKIFHHFDDCSAFQVVPTIEPLRLCKLLDPDFYSTCK